MLTNVLLWTLLGILSGVIIHFLFPSDQKKLAGTISAGLLGAFFGGAIYSIFSIGSVAVILDPIASFVAVFVAVALIFGIRRVVRVKAD